MVLGMIVLLTLRLLVLITDLMHECHDSLMNLVLITDVEHVCFVNFKSTSSDN